VHPEHCSDELAQSACAAGAGSFHPWAKADHQSPAASDPRDLTRTGEGYKRYKAVAPGRVILATSAPNAQPLWASIVSFTLTPLTVSSIEPSVGVGAVW
jgi:hypothetical protein